MKACIETAKNHEKGTAQNPFTQEDVDKIQPDKLGVRHMPFGYYAAMCVFPSWCSFRRFCRFGNRCSFGENCSFLEQCNFGARCKFNARCEFGYRCSFGITCIFGSRCRFGSECGFSYWTAFGSWCIFDDGCSFDSLSFFGSWCSFNSRCTFAERCRFGKGSSFEGGRLPDDWRNPYFAVDRIGSEHRKAYFFSFGGVIYVRAGCFFGDESAFIAKLESDADSRKTRQYLAALELARVVLQSEVQG